MHGSSPAGITKWPLGLMVMTAASQAANVEFKSRRGHLWVGRIAAIAAGLHSVSVGSKPTSTGRCEPVNPPTSVYVGSSPPLLPMFTCPRWFKVPLRSTSVVAEQVSLAPSDLLRRCAVILHRRFEFFRKRYYMAEIKLLIKCKHEEFLLNLIFRRKTINPSALKEVEVCELL